jgi:hypothetical protein
VLPVDIQAIVELNIPHALDVGTLVVALRGLPVVAHYRPLSTGRANDVVAVFTDPEGKPSSPNSAVKRER